jgi:hypothetical protein
VLEQDVLLPIPLELRRPDPIKSRSTSRPTTSNFPSTSLSMMLHNSAEPHADPAIVDVAVVDVLPLFE